MKIFLMKLTTFILILMNPYLTAPMSGGTSPPRFHVAVLPQFFTQDWVAIHGSFRIGCDIQIVQKGAEAFSMVKPV